MRVNVVQGSIAAIDADAVIVNLFAGVKSPGGATGAVDRATGGMISRLIAQEAFAGKLGECLTFYTDRLGAASSDRLVKVVVAGLGPQASFDLEGARRAAAAAIKAASGPRINRVATIVHGAGIGGLDAREAAQALTEGSLLAAYRFEPYKSREPQNESRATLPQELLVVEFDALKLAPIEEGVARGRLFAEATNAARDLVNTPPGKMRPEDLAAAARRVAQQAHLACEVLDEEAMERLGMGALLGVARGSAAPPRLVVMQYRGGQEGPPDIALVGKGVTFDSGGLSLKTAEGMITMKDDMAGAAAVIGAMRIIGALRPPVNVLAVVPCVENMPSGTALQPGEVLHTFGGKSIEVHNTDAEGRLILADAVAYARAQGARAIVDVATLTGACGIALGDLYSGVVSNSDRLVDLLQQAAARTGERYWRLPSDDEYKEKYASDIADIKNVGGRLGGAIIGGMIVGEFAGDTPWLHIDIAPTAFVEKARHYLPKGASGVAVRTLAELVLAGGY